MAKYFTVEFFFSYSSTLKNLINNSPAEIRREKIFDTHLSPQILDDKFQTCICKTSKSFTCASSGICGI